MTNLQEFAKIYNDLAKYPKISDVANYFKINERSVRRTARKARDAGVSLIKRSKNIIPESETIFREHYSRANCIDELVKLQKENDGVFITRNFYRYSTLTSDSTWNRYFGTFDEFKRQAGLTLSRAQQQLEKDIAKHASRDSYLDFNEERKEYEGKYLKPNNNRFKTLLIASDLHDIECDKFFLRTFLDVAKRVQPDVICIAGDLFDLPEFGKYLVDPREWNVVNRIKFVHENILAPLRANAPNSQIDLIEGNHECVSLDTEVLTSEGWVKAVDLRYNSRIASFSTTEEKINFENPVAMKAYKFVESVHVVGTLTNECISKSHRIFLDGKLEPVRNWIDKSFRQDRKKLSMDLNYPDAQISDEDLKALLTEAKHTEDFSILTKLSKRQLKVVEETLTRRYFLQGDSYITHGRARAEALQMSYVFNGMPAVVKFVSNSWRVNVFRKKFNSFVEVHRADRQTVIAIQTVDGTLITKRQGIINFTGNCRLIKHLAEATPALRAVLSDLHGFTVSKLLGLDKYEINYIAKADLKAWNKRDEEKELANNYKVYFDSFLVHHLPQARNMGMPGCHGHHHKHIVWSSFSPTFGTYEWHQLGCGHKRSASYCEGEKWGLGFGLVHIDTQTKTTNFEYIPVTDFAIAGGKWYQRDFSTEQPF